MVASRTRESLASSLAYWLDASMPIENIAQIPPRESEKRQPPARIPWQMLTNPSAQSSRLEKPWGVRPSANHHGKSWIIQNPLYASASWP